MRNVRRKSAAYALMVILLAYVLVFGVLSLMKWWAGFETTVIAVLAAMWIFLKHEK